MKKTLAIISIVTAVIFCGLKVSAATFSEVIKLKKPCAVLIYADWADDAQEVMMAFKANEKKAVAKYNFVTLNIADEETREFNKLYHIYPNLPYVLLFKDNGKISRLLKKDCILSDSCFADKLDLFAN